MIFLDKQCTQPLAGRKEATLSGLLKIGNFFFQFTDEQKDAVDLLTVSKAYLSDTKTPFAYLANTPLYLVRWGNEEYELTLFLKRNGLLIENSAGLPIYEIRNIRCLT